MVFIASMISSVSPATTLLPMSMKGARAWRGPAIGGADHRRFHGAGMLGEVGCSNDGR